MHTLFLLKIMAKHNRSRCIAMPLIGMLLALCINSGIVAASTSASGFIRAVSMPGWKPEQQPYTYSPSNLYNYINGAADFFIVYGFVELAGATYLPVAEHDSSSITIDIYDMDKKLNAFAVFQARRDLQLPSFNIGAASFAADGLAAFHKGRYYVEIQAFLTDKKHKDVLKKAAEKVVSQIPGDNSLPKELSFFPAESRITGSEQYIKGGILGHGFLNRGLLCSYQLPGGKATAFIASLPSKEQALKAFQQHRSFLKKAGKQCRDLAGTRNHGFISEEPYHKKIIVWQEGCFVAGVYDLVSSDTGKGEKLLEEIVKKLKRALPF